MRRLLSLVVLVFMVMSCWAQVSPNAITATVPPLIKVSGTISGDSGSTVGVTFALYAEQTGGAPLWLETQNVALNANGRYTIYLGANHANGVPLDLFASGEARWLGVQPEGQAEQARVQLVSVPYAMTAGDAQTLGGQPLSAFVMASSANGSATTASSAATTAAASGGIVALATPQTGGSVTTSGGTTNYLAKFTSATDVENSSLVYDSGTAVGIGTTAPAATLHVVSTSTSAGFVDVYSNTLNAVMFATRAARGTPAAPAVVQAGDIIGGFTGRGWTGPVSGSTGGFSGGRGALIIHANETWSTTAQSTYMQFNTTALGAAAQSERMRLDNAGNLGIGTSNPGGTPPSPLPAPVTLEVNGNVKLTAGSGGGVTFQDGTKQSTAFTGTNGGVYTAGTGLNLVGSQFSVNFGSVQAPINQSCPAGSFISSINVSGTANCTTVGTFATLGSNNFAGTETVAGVVDVSDNGTFSAASVDVLSEHTIHGETNRAGAVWTSQDVNTFFPNTPAAVFGISNDQTVDAFSVGVKGITVGPWGTGVSGTALDNTPGSDDSPTAVSGRTFSSASGANGVVAKILGPTTSTSYSTAASGNALFAEAVSSNASAGMFVNDNGYNSGSGSLIKGYFCSNTPTAPPSGGWQSWHDCPSSQRSMVFQVDFGGHVYGNGVRTWYPNSGTGTGLNLLAVLSASSGSPSTVVVSTPSTSTSSTNGIIGVVTGGAGTTGNATIAIEGTVKCYFDNAATAGDIVVASPNTAGYCYDAGYGPSYQGSYGQVLGWVQTSGSAGLNLINLFGPASMLSASGSGSGGGSGTITGVTAGTGLTGGGTSGTVTLNVDFTQVQPILTGLSTGASCGTNQFVTTVNSNGTVKCGTTSTVASGALILSSGGQVTGDVSVVPPTTGAGLYALSVTQNQQGAAPPPKNSTAAWMATVPAAIVGTATDNSGNVAVGVLGQATGAGDLAMVATSVGEEAPTMFVWNQNTTAGMTDNNTPEALDVETSAQYGKVLEVKSDASAGAASCSGSNCNDLEVIRAKAVATSGAVTLFYGEAQSPAAQGISLNFDTALNTSCSTSGSQCGSVFNANVNGVGYFSIDGGLNLSTPGNISANNANFSGSLSAGSLGLSTATITSLTVPGGISTNNIGIIGSEGSTMTIQAGTTIFGGEVNIPSGMLTVSGTGSFGGPLTASNGLNVSGGGGVTIGNGGLTVNSSGQAATFNGGVNVNGSFYANTLAKGSGSFKIDHPLDPANKYLYHSFVESPDMMNIYNGVIVLDRRGTAWIQMPDYFEALNKDFRYQLTAIGAPGPNLYIAKEISGNRFRIAGGKPGMKVSWQVTGVRHDAWADAHRIQVEEEKTGKERGTYLHPELFPEKTAVAHK